MKLKREQGMLIRAEKVDDIVETREGGSS